jgi:hypothetical protein
LRQEDGTRETYQCFFGKILKSPLYSDFSQETY